MRSQFLPADYCPDPCPAYKFDLKAGLLFLLIVMIAGCGNAPGPVSTGRPEPPAIAQPTPLASATPESQTSAEITQERPAPPSRVPTPLPVSAKMERPEAPAIVGAMEVPKAATPPKLTELTKAATTEPEHPAPVMAAPERTPPNMPPPPSRTPPPRILQPPPPPQPTPKPEAPGGN